MPTSINSQFEEHVGPHGLKVQRLLTAGTRDQESGSGSNLQSSSSNLSFYGSEDFTQAVERLARSWRWWAESYGYFNRKSDAQIFEEEVKFMLQNGYFSPDLAQWQFTGVRGTYNDRGPKQSTYYIDPDTEQIVITKDSYNQPDILNNGKVIGYINLDKIADDVKLLSHVIRLVTVILDASIFMAGSKDESLITELAEKRSIEIMLVTLNDLPTDELLKAKAWLLMTSSELASIFGGKESHEEIGNEYVDFLLDKYQLRNLVEITTNQTDEAYALFNIEKPMQQEIQVESSEKRVERKSSTKSNQPSNHSTTQLSRNAHFHKFEIEGVECYLVAELDAEGRVQTVQVQHPQYSPRENELLRTAVHLLLENGGNGTTFGQPVIDYLNQWIQQ